ncbi:MAG: pyridoxal phosphate-dependent aminotransferase [Halobacteriaceae archaeon]
MEYEEPLIFAMMSYADRADRDVVTMVSGSPDWEPPDGLRAGLREYADAPPAEFQYAASEGLTPLREELAARRNVDVDRVVVTNGAGEANHLAMHGALERFDGDEVVLADPVYPYYAGRTEMLGATPRYVPVDDDGRLDPADVAEVTSGDTACIVVCSPNNPTGAVYGESVKRALLEVAEDSDALLLSDEVYDHFDYAGRFQSALAFDSSHYVVTNSFSKSLAVTGFRVGYGVFPPSMVGPAKTRHMLTNVSTTRPAQRAVLDALRTTDPAYFAATREMLADRVATFTAALDDVGAEYVDPEGAFYVLARFPDFPGSMPNAKRLVDEAGVAGMPGEAFGSARPDWFRFALVSDRTDVAADRLRAFFDGR